MALKVQKRFPLDLSDLLQLDFVKDDASFLEDIHFLIRPGMNRSDFVPKLLVAFLCLLKGGLHSRFFRDQGKGGNEPDGLPRPRP